MPVITPINGTTYQMQVGRDTAVLGDAASAQCLAHLVHNRWHGHCRYALSYPGSPSGPAAINPSAGTIRIPYGTVTVELTGHDPSDDAPDGRTEFNVILNQQPTPDANGEYWQVLSFTREGITDFARVLGLDEEFDQARCSETWDHNPGPFTITPTEIRDAGNTLLKTRPEHEVHSLKGQADDCDHFPSVLGKHPQNGQDITYTRLSRDTLSLPRRMLVDDRGRTARIEDVVLDGNQIKFKLPAAFIEAGSTRYPVRHATGVDPAYTQGMSYLDGSGTDGVWVDLNLDSYIPESAVGEFIIANIQAGTENQCGIRTYGSSVERIVDVHEAEAGGQTHVRMFAYNTPGTVGMQWYGEDISDARFYIVGYWQNVSFTEQFEVYYHSGSPYAAFEDLTLDAGASAVHHCLLYVADEAAHTLGVRANGSALDRKLKVHEAEAGGCNMLDMLVKADASKVIEIYESSSAAGCFIDLGYFGTELDFVEKWTTVQSALETWITWDITNYLDQDGRMIDMLHAHAKESATAIMGCRDGDDTTTERSLTEHEAESSGSGGEYAGFGMSCKSNSSGHVYVKGSSGASQPYPEHWHTGYFKPGAGGATTYTKTYDIDTRLATRKTKTYDIDARLAARTTKTYDIDTILATRTTKTKAYDIDVRVATRVSKTYDIDTRLATRKTKTYDIDVRAATRSTKAYDVDALLATRTTKTKTYDIDARVATRQTKTYDIDTRLAARKTKTYDADARVAARLTKAYDIDTRVGTRQTKAYDIDAILATRTTKTKAYDIDTRVGTRLTKAYDIDGRVATRLTKAYDTDTVLAARTTKTKTYDIDARLASRLTKTYDADVRVATRLTKTYDIDVILQSLGGTKTISYDIDARLASRLIKAYDVDARLATRTSKAYDVDARLASRQTKAYDIDSRLAARLTKAYDADTRLAARTTAAYDVDVRLASRATEAYDIDAIIATRTTKTQVYDIDTKVCARGQVNYLIDVILVGGGGPAVIDHVRHFKRKNKVPIGMRDLR